jgi:putative addiction module component (TIGR02574 family)
MATAEEHLQELLKLPTEERIRIAQLLLESVESDVDPDVEAAWSAEIRRRVQSVEDGTAVLVEWGEAKRRVRERLREIRLARSADTEQLARSADTK